MTQTRKLIHNMEKVSQDMIDYIMNPKNESELIRLIGSVGNEYKKPMNSYFWGPIYAVLRLRVRGPAVNGLLATVNQNKNARLMLTAIVNFFETGSWAKTTSANPNLMYEIIARLPDYQQSDPNPRLSLTLIEIHELHAIFKAKAVPIIHAVKGDETQKSGIMKELSNVPKRDIREVGSQLPSGSLYKKKPLTEVKRLDDEKFKDLKQTLESLFQSHQILQQLGGAEKMKRGVRAKPDVSPVDNVTPAESPTQLNEFVHPYAETIVMAPPPPPPPPPLSSAGLFANHSPEKVKSTNENYLPPTQRKLTAEQIDLISRVYASKVESQIVRGTCDDNVVSAMKP